MKAAGFRYARAADVGEALAAFRTCEGDARYLAGGQSLLPALNLRLAAVDLLVDISRIPELAGIEVRGDAVRIGATTRHAEVLRSATVAAEVPLLRAAAAFVAHPAIRNKGTIGGSLALADPAAEFPAVALALRARLEVRGEAGTRFVEAEDFFAGIYETALAPGELLAAIWLPRARAGQRFAFDELARRRGDYAMIGLAAAAEFEGDRVAGIDLVLFSAGPTPMRARRAEAILLGSRLEDDAVASAVRALDADLAFEDAPGLSAATRGHLARVLVGRGLAALRDAARGRGP